jgi:nucleoside-diphosphate-sugar epimerase
MKVLVTGGSGYFGTRLIEILSAEEIQIESFDIGYFWNCWLGKKSTIVEHAVSAQELTESLISNFDAVIHFAGISNDPLKQLNESDMHDSSLEYSRTIAEICKRNSISFIYASSCSVYGKQFNIVDEHSLVNPQTPYSQNKIQIENMLLTLRDLKWSPVILRFSTLYGFSPRMRFDTVINMLCGMGLVEDRISLNSNGEAHRPFLHIDDACLIVKSILEICIQGEEYKITGAVINVGSNDLNFSIKEISDLVSNETGKPVEMLQLAKTPNELILDRKHQDGVDSRSYVVNFDKLRGILGNEVPHRNIKEGIQKTLFDLKTRNFDKHNFYDKSFYRLQFLEDCIDIGILDKNLQFIK